MSQNSGCCDSNDFSIQSANVGIATLTTGNTDLTGLNATPVLIAAGANGTIIKSVRIKALSPVTTGVIRLFIGTAVSPPSAAVSLYKEIPVTTTPAMAATPTPAPVLPTFEIILNGGFKLKSGWKLFATTQNSESFNIIAEGMDWKYPGTTPASCCNFKKDAANTGIGIPEVNTHLDGTTGTYTNIFTAAGSTNGCFVKTVTIKALQSTSNNGMIRIFLYDTTTYFLLTEVMVPQTNQSGFEPSFKAVVDINMNINTGWGLGATTQLGQSFALTVEALDYTYAIS